MAFEKLSCFLTQVVGLRSQVTKRTLLHDFNAVQPVKLMVLRNGSARQVGGQSNDADFQLERLESWG
jgi:hypothetical protein